MRVDHDTVFGIIQGLVRLDITSINEWDDWCRLNWKRNDGIISNLIAEHKGRELQKWCARDQQYTTWA